MSEARQGSMSRRGRRGAARAVGLAAALALVGAGGAAGQTFDVPSFHAPYGETGYGLYLILQNDVDDVGIMGTWRQAGPELDLGVRAGLLSVDDDLGLFLGVDFKNEFVRAGPDFPLDAAWVTGVGVGGVPDADLALVRVPFGVSLGRTVTPEGSDVRLTPYLHPRLALDILFVDRGPMAGGDDTDADLTLDVDLGLDLHLPAGPTLRLGITLGENEALGLGVAF